MRILLSTLVFVSLATVLHAKSFTPLAKSGVQTDPIVTGVRVTVAQKEKWLKDRAAWIACGKCAPSQPFPEAD